MGTLSSKYPDSNAVEAALNRANSASHDVAQLSDTMTGVLERLDALEYVDVKINTFTASPSLCELGTLNTINLTWTLSKPSNATIDGVAVTGTTYSATNVSSNHTFVLSVTDGQTSDNKSVSVSFANQIYYGVAENTSAVTSLSGKVLSNTKSRTITVNAGSSQYIIYAIPARLGNVAFYVGGFEGGFEDPVEQLLTNSSGYVETYKVYRSTNAGLGNTTVEIREV